jgi:hypothetical protein
MEEADINVMKDTAETVEVSCKFEKDHIFIKKSHFSAKFGNDP